MRFTPERNAPFMGLSLRLPLEAVICDMDGLLVDSEGFSTQAWDVALARYGITLTEADVADMFGLRIDEDAALILHRYPRPISVADLVQAKSSAMLELIAGALQPMPGALELVAWLETHAVPHALATSGLGDYAAVCLDTVGIGTSFPIRITGDMVPRGKPAPDIFLEAARRLGSVPERCLVLEDAPHGVAAARAAGMAVIAVPNKHTADLAFPPPTLRLASLHEVLAHLEIS
jgi:HAD superfamily hydrolase (TIGR01509 family)